MSIYVGFCEKWLQGNDPVLRRAAAQTLGLVVETEGARVARRVVDWLPALLPLLQRHVALVC
jgi:hypothetical protein